MNDRSDTRKARGNARNNRGATWTNLIPWTGPWYRAVLTEADRRIRAAHEKGAGR